MLWKNINIESVVKTDKKLTYNNEPLRFQIPRGYCEYGVSEYKALTVTIQDEEFTQWFRSLEKHVFPTEEFESNLNENTFRVKFVDGFSQIFDSDGTYIMEGFSFTNTNMDILVDMSNVYSPFKDFKKHGFVCKIYQAKIIPIGCLFESFVD